jgi:transcriptional regulator with XRE-family HTH domain
VRLTAAKLEQLADQGDSLGAHLRRTRKERGLKQSEVAELMGVSHTSILDWEAGKRPFDRMYPAIIAFLGYEPWAEPETLADTLRCERRRPGLSAKATANLLGVDEATYARWERGKQPSCPQHDTSVAIFLAG